MVLDLLSSFLAEKVEPEAVFLAVIDREEFILELGKMCRFHIAFEDGILDSYSIIQTGFCDLPESASTFCCRYTDIVGNQYQHCYFTM